MVVNDLLYGNQNQWKLLQLIGEGDAGEVYLVESVRDKRRAILKRPHRNGSSEDVNRQAAQISTEGTILRALQDFSLPVGGTCIQVVRLLDQCTPGTESSEGVFIIIEEARGFDLVSLARAAHFNYSDSPDTQDSTDPILLPLLQSLTKTETVPILVLLRALDGLFSMLDAIHIHNVHFFDSTKSGILWNDVKPEHIFWDPANRCFTVIDWGNGQLLEDDGVTVDRQFSPMDDYRQAVEAMGKFLSETVPELYMRLEWDQIVITEEEAKASVAGVREMIGELLQDELASLITARQDEALLLQSLDPGIQQMQSLLSIHERILLSGELPDFEAAARFFTRLASGLVTTGNLTDFLQVSEQIVRLPGIDVPKWETLASLAQEAGSPDSSKSNQSYGSLQQAIRFGMEEEWSSVLWQLALYTLEDTNPDHWLHLSQVVRANVAEINTKIPTPYQSALRLLQDLEMAPIPEDSPSLASFATAREVSAAAQRQRLPLLTNRLREIIKKWLLVNPTPPGASLEYADLDKLVEELSECLPVAYPDSISSLQSLSRSLYQPHAQVEIILDAWKAKGFKTAQRGLHHLLLWDPERRRVLTIDPILETTAEWIDEVRQGPHRGEKIQEYAIRLEFKGRELRSRIGSAHWLDPALTIFADLRTGIRPADLVAETPTLINDFPWMKKYHHKPLHPGGRLLESSLFEPPVDLESRLESLESHPGSLGNGQDLMLAESLDTWVPEARGSSARVFLGFLKDREGHLKQAAIKVMRPDKAEYALPLFMEEVQILTLMRDVLSVVRMLECGFLCLDDGQDLPHEDSHSGSMSPARSLTGKVLRIPIEDSVLFLASLITKTGRGWLPYIAVERKNNLDNLLPLCDEGHHRGNYLPLRTSLQICLQICEVIQAAHLRNIVYRDHKLIHYYWNSIRKKVFVIDWNVAKWHRSGLSDAERQGDLVQFGARALHHILTGRPAPGALPVGPTRPEEIEQAPNHYATSWNYDDVQRLPDEVRGVLSRVLAGEYTSAAELHDDLQYCLAQLSLD